MQTFAPPDYAGPPLPVTTEDFLAELLIPPFRVLATGAAKKTIRVFFASRNLGYINQTTMARGATVGYRFEQSNHSSDSSPINYKDALVREFCQRHKCLPAAIDVHEGSGQNAGRLFLLIRHPEDALRILRSAAAAEPFETATRLYFVNTDAVSFDGVSRHDEWLRRGIIVTSGEPRYKNALNHIPAGARVLIYVNGVGVVAVGKVTSEDVDEVKPPQTVNSFEPIEYHKTVTWLLDLRDDPISRNDLVKLLGQGPMQAVQEVHAGKKALLHRLATLEAVPTIDGDTYLRVSFELGKCGPVDRPVGTLEPRCTSSQGIQFSRDPRVRAWALQRAEGRCELCGQPAPFLDKYLEPYFETHHIIMLADGGADTPDNTATLCPNCHRELHYGTDRQDKTEELRALIGTKERVA